MRDEEFVVTKGVYEDIEELTALYDDLNDTMQKGINYPGWIKHVYPVRETAAEGIEAKTLYVLRDGSRIAGTIILNNMQPEPYKKLKWNIIAKDDEILVVHTLAVHAEYLGRGIGRRLLEFTDHFAAGNNIKAIRLDTFKNNLPAIKLYEKCGYGLVGEVDLELNVPGLDMFKCYEKAVKPKM